MANKKPMPPKSKGAAMNKGKQGMAMRSSNAKGKGPKPPRPSAYV